MDFPCLKASVLSKVLEMSDLEKDETPMLSEADSQYLDEPRVSHSHRLTSRNRSASISIPMNSMESYQTESSLVSHTGPLRNEKKTPFIPMSGPLSKSEGFFPPTPGVWGHRKAEPRAENFPSFNGMEWNNRPHNNYAGKNEHLLRSGQLGVCNDPYCTICPTHFIDSRQQRNSKENKCIIFDLPLTKTIVVFRSLTDFIYLLNMLLQFRLAYVAPESRVVGAGDLVDHPKKIAIHYLHGYFLIDLFIVLPLPQRVNQCLRDACHNSEINNCMDFIDCGHGEKVRDFRQNSEWQHWKSNENASACFSTDGFPYGIYAQAVILTTKPSIVTRYTYSFFWGFQVHIFSKMGDSKMGDTILDAICERLRQKTYIKGSKILCDGGLIEKMVFIVRGKMLSNGVATPLGEGDVCGEELLAWCIENSSVNKDGKKIRFPGQRLLSNRDVECLTNVEAFILRAADIEEVTGIFSRFLRNPKVQGAIRYQSPYWRTFAATRIQVAWRYRKKCLSRADTSNTQFNRL
ncbi:hypothetical protein PVL29_022879 [Vitis rotundifolia]|uniref:Cyclic nucleotide-binding domain-containing protein n=1 Tax=Vitis rotundifolia TaxID=103349 RepID=A0AA38YX40_VITRO|nr:hypothetical protein PVL29_022879 [Vitis rotundifolia]